MSTTDASTTIGPEAHVSWRATSLGVVTEALEQCLILDMMGELAGGGRDRDRSRPGDARRRAVACGEGGCPCNVLEGRVERLPFPDASFDVAASITVPCFVPDAADAVREMTRTLRPGGRLVRGELGRWSLWAMFRRLRGWLGWPTWKPARFRAATGLRALAKGAGLFVTEIPDAVYYRQVGLLARAPALIDSWLGRLTTLGAAFVAFRAVRVNGNRQE